MPAKGNSNNWQDATILGFSDTRKQHEIQFDGATSAQWIVSTRSLNSRFGLPRSTSVLTSTCAQDLNSQRVIEYGELVWAKMKGYPYWPAQVRHSRAHQL